MSYSMTWLPQLPRLVVINSRHVNPLLVRAFPLKNVLAKEILALLLLLRKPPRPPHPSL
jgi:hypothetical protein